MAAKDKVKGQKGESQKSEGKPLPRVSERRVPPAFDAGHRPLDVVYGLPTNVASRKTIVFLVEVSHSNPNIDPDRHGSPRISRDGRGFISSQAINRKVRDYLDSQGHRLFVARETDLGDTMASFVREGSKKASSDDMLEAFADIRLFGATLTQGDRKICGAWQCAGAHSVLPVTPMTQSLTRVSSHNSGDSDKQAGMGRRTVIEHALYVGVYQFDPRRAAEAMLTESDMAMFYEALINGWQASRSAARTGVNLRRMFVFDHGKPVEQTHVTPERVKVSSRVVNPSRFEDYKIELLRGHWDADGDGPNRVYTWSDGSEHIKAAFVRGEATLVA